MSLSAIGYFFSYSAGMSKSSREEDTIMVGSEASMEFYDGTCCRRAFNADGCWGLGMTVFKFWRG